MGCFDANCCLTGLPLQQYDPVRAALVVPSLYRESRGTQPWLFWTLPVQGQYNDYGSIEWEDVPEDQLQILELILNLTKPHFKKDEKYTTRVSGKSIFITIQVTSKGEPMSQFTITMKTDNAAFDPNPEMEVVRILRTVADKIEATGLGEDIVLRDINGNRVGQAETVTN